MPRELDLSCVVTGCVEVEFHPDVVGRPDTGAVKSVTVDGLDWPKLQLPPIIKMIEPIPFARDLLYHEVWAPLWVGGALAAIWSAYNFNVLTLDRLQGALEYVATRSDLQQQIGGATRVGLNPMEVFAIIDPEL